MGLCPTIIDGDWSSVRKAIQKLSSRLGYTATPTFGGMILTGAITAPNFISNVAVGTSPFATTSTTLNTNLNADLLDGQHASAFLTSYSETDPVVKALTGIIKSSGTAIGTVTVSSPLDYTTGTLSIPAATSSVNGYMTSTFAGYLDQAVKIASSPTFANITDSGIANTYVPYSVNGLLTGSANFLFNGSTFALLGASLIADSYINIAKSITSRPTGYTYGIYESITPSWTGLGLTSPEYAAYFEINDSSIISAARGSSDGPNLFGVGGQVKRTSTFSYARGSLTTYGFFFQALNEGTFTGISGTLTQEGMETVCLNQAILNNATSNFVLNNFGGKYTVSSAVVNTASASITINNYGIYLTIADGSPSAAVVTNYGIYNVGITGGDKNYFLYDANSVMNILSGLTRIGGTTDPTYACDVTGVVNASTGYRCGGTAPCADNTYALPTSITTKGGIITAIS